ncbi:hypothetical protein [Pseudofrankia sp. BMG5.37]|uniref:hypothetical protein n=1 Tax=Pseudofrankia sp. BMG5.37 TaxID=3050035 RepID=UPI0028945D57|nr:hypothetical protein [Pseudofrankia sp. BMG5.37]MDT3442693.1 hypothetical protein [Pseudofrankia sp. BMG5.37]
MRTTVCGNEWVVPRPPEQIDAAIPPDRVSEQGWKDWKPGADGVIASPSTVLITMQGTSESQVTLTDVRIRVHERRPPITGTVLAAQCGDSGSYRYMTVDLDVNPPKIGTYYDSASAEFDGVPSVQRTPISFPYRVSRTDAETLQIVANTQNCECLWSVELSWSAEGRTGVLSIDDHGHPFRTTSTTNAVSCYVLENPMPCEDQHH